MAMRDTAATSLAVRSWLDCENFNVFTMNFLNVNKASGIPVVPFLEASKAMTRGNGYAEKAMS
jgi:L-arabinose isomerase